MRNKCNTCNQNQEPTPTDVMLWRYRRKLLYYNMHNIYMGGKVSSSGYNSSVISYDEYMQNYWKYHMYHDPHMTPRPIPFIMPQPSCHVMPPYMPYSITHMTWDDTWDAEYHMPQWYNQSEDYINMPMDDEYIAG